MTTHKKVFVSPPTLGMVSKFVYEKEIKKKRDIITNIR